MKHQIIFIRGGESFETKEQFYEYLKNRDYNPFDTHKTWRDWISWTLSDEFEMMTPTMPNKQWADYEAWKIWFEKLFPYINEQKLVLIGHSLGGVFLAKYLSEHKFPKPIDQLHLVCPVYDDEGIHDEKIASFKFDPGKLPAIQKQAARIFLYHSDDDPVVPISHSERYAAHWPSARFERFSDRGHFIQPAFIEILNNIYEALD